VTTETTIVETTPAPTAETTTTVAPPTRAVAPAMTVPTKMTEADGQRTATETEMSATTKTEMTVADPATTTMSTRRRGTVNDAGSTMIVDPLMLGTSPVSLKYTQGMATRGDFDAENREKSPELTEEERDQRTVFVQQLAARLRTKELIKFFEQAGPVREAQIVKDRISGRSKGYPHPTFCTLANLSFVVSGMLSLEILVRLPRLSV
jgi:RNA recognition motif. (a.k.a. RRM, RBD, or RNP domain)